MEITLSENRGQKHYTKKIFSGSFNVTKKVSKPLYLPLPLLSFSFLHPFFFFSKINLKQTLSMETFNHSIKIWDSAWDVFVLNA